MKDKEFKLAVISCIILLIIVIPAIAMVISENRLHRTGFLCESDFDCGLAKTPDGSCCETCGFEEIVNVDETKARNKWRDENCEGEICEEKDCADVSAYDDIRCLRGKCTGIRKEANLDPKRDITIYDNKLTGAVVAESIGSDGRLSFNDLDLIDIEKSHIGFQGHFGKGEYARLSFSLPASPSTDIRIGGFKFSLEQGLEYELDLLSIDFESPIMLPIGMVKGVSLGYKSNNKVRNITQIPFDLPFIDLDFDSSIF
jgi:hypothetical protein